MGVLKILEPTAYITSSRKIWNIELSVTPANYLILAADDNWNMDTIKARLLLNCYKTTVL